MGLGNVVRRALPKETRIRLRRSSVVNGVLKAVAGGKKVRPHPRADFTIAFDGFRNLGWTFGRLPETEKAYFAFTEHLLDRLRPDHVWDVGANVGLWTLFLAGRDPKIRSIVAYEPDATNLQWLQENVGRNRLNDRVTIRDVALSDDTGTATFNADAYTGATGSLESGESFIARHFHLETHPVEIMRTTADEELRAGVAAPGFVKVDVEGHEASLFRGARLLLGDIRPAILLELSGNDSEGLKDQLQQADYRLVDPVRRKLVSGDDVRWEVAAIPAEKVDKLELSR